MSLKKPTVFRGVATALITPFCEQRIDYPALRAMIESQIRADVGALLVAGTTGEGSTLSEEELGELISFAASVIDGRVPLLAGCSSNCTKRAVRLAEIAEQAGADALLSVTPYYNKASERGLVAHYTAIADSIRRPLLLYNVPSRTGVSMTPEVYRELARHPNVVGIKEASGDLLLTESVVGDLSDRMDVYTGNDHQFTAALKLGCTGVISVYSNLFPCEMLEIWRAWCNGDAAGASRRQRQLRPYLDAMFCEVNPIPVKYVASLLGICQAEYRLPLCPPSAETARTLKKLFADKLPAP